MISELLPVIVGLPLALLAGAYGLAKGVAFLRAIVRGRGQVYSPPCIPTRQNTITGTPARRIIAHPFVMANFDNELQAAHTRLEGRKHATLGKRK